VFAEAAVGGAPLHLPVAVPDQVDEIRTDARFSPRA
jgi:hypothetical protein